MTSSAFITSVKFQLKLLSSEYLFRIISFNELSITLYSLWLGFQLHCGTVVPSLGERVAVTESLNRDVSRVSICGVTCG